MKYTLKQEKLILQTASRHLACRDDDLTDIDLSRSLDIGKALVDEALKQGFLQSEANSSDEVTRMKEELKEKDKKIDELKEHMGKMISVMEDLKKQLDKKSKEALVMEKEALVMEKVIDASCELNEMMRR